MLYLVHLCQLCIRQGRFQYFPQKISKHKDGRICKKFWISSFIQPIALMGSDAKEGQLLCPEFDGKSS